MARAGSLADAQVMKLLNERFVPLYIDYDAYVFDAAAMKASPDPKVRALVDTMERFRAKEEAFGVTFSHEPFRPVHLTIVTPEGEVADYLDIESLLDTATVRTALEKASAGVKPGLPLVRAFCAADLCTDADDLALHVVSRFLIGPDEVPARLPGFLQIGVRPDGWHDAPPSVLENRVKAPAREWFTLKKEQWRGLVEGSGTWEVQAPLAREILQHFAPPGEIYKLDPDRLQSWTMTATVVDDSETERTVRLQGSLVLTHPWWDLRDDERVEASFTGYVKLDKAAGRIASFEMASDGGRYRGGQVRPALDIPLGVALHGPAE